MAIVERAAAEEAAASPPLGWAAPAVRAVRPDARPESRRSHASTWRVGPGRCAAGRARSTCCAPMGCAVSATTASRRPPAGARGARVRVAEPWVALRARHPVVVDAAVLAAVLFDDRPRRGAASPGRHHAACAWLIDYEIASVAARKAAAGLGEVAAQGLADFRALAIERAAVDPAAIAGLAMSYGITPYDAAYLWARGRAAGTAGDVRRRAGAGGATAPGKQGRLTRAGHGSSSVRA